MRKISKLLKLCVVNRTREDADQYISNGHEGMTWFTDYKQALLAIQTAASLHRAVEILRRLAKSCRQENTGTRKTQV